MKKLMIGAFALAAAFAANAGSVNWSIEGINTTDGNPGASGYLAYLLVDSGDGFTGDAFSRTAALAAIEGGDFSFLSNALVGDWGEAGVLVDGGAAEDYNVGLDLFTDNSTDVKSYLVIVNADTIDNATKAFVTDLADTPIPLGEGSPVFDVAGTADPGSWVTAAPEPTSGLLLLLGVGALALRRRRA